MKSETLAAKAVEKTLRGKVQKQTFPPRLEIPQKTRDSHFSHSLDCCWILFPWWAHWFRLKPAELAPFITAANIFVPSQRLWALGPCCPARQARNSCCMSPLVLGSPTATALQPASISSRKNRALRLKYHLMHKISRHVRCEPWRTGLW